MDGDNDPMGNGKIAVITGGSQGIGFHIAHQLLTDEFYVFIAARTEKTILKTVENFRKHFTSIEGVVCDISDWKSVLNLVDKVKKNFERITVLVNNAGVQWPIGKVCETDRSQWCSNININLIGTYNCIYAFLPFFIRQRYGKIINVSGGGSTSSRPYFSAYAVAKTGIVRLTEVVADEYRDYNIDVNAVSPGAVNTAFLDEVIAHGELISNPEYYQALERSKNGGESPEHVAKLVSFLASEKSDGISGKLISAIWDPWQEKEFKQKAEKQKNFATLRRIDDKYFREI